MAKFFTEIGFAEPLVETAPGVWEEVIVEHKFYGDILRNNRRLNPGETSNLELNAGNTFSIVADAYAIEHFYAIRYFRWVGQLWTVSTVEVLAPRLNLTLGGVYNGPVPSEASDTTGDIDGEPI